MSEPQPYGAKINTQEIINYCHSRALSAIKVALTSSDGTQMVTIPIASPDASIVRISAMGGSFGLSADAGGNRVSCIQGDAGLHRVSAIGSFSVSAHEVKQSDASALRVSAIIDNGSVSAIQSLPNTVWSGRTSIASSSNNTQLGSASLYQGVIIKAISSNTSACYVGNSAVGPTTFHYELEPGEATAVGVNNLSCIYIAVIANNDGVQYIGS